MYNDAYTTVNFTDKKDLQALLNGLGSGNGKLLIVHDNKPELWQAFTSCFVCIQAAGGLLYSGTDWLFIRRRGIWDLPKGKHEPGETTEQNAIREVMEECGLTRTPVIRKFLTDTYHIYRQDGRPILKQTAWFLMDAGPKPVCTPQYEEEITEIRWVPFNRTNNINDSTFPSIQDVIDTGKLAFEELQLNQSSPSVQSEISPV